MKKEIKTITFQDSSSAEKKLKFNDHLALFITKCLGNINTIYICIIFIFFWMFIGYETYEDPYPFPLLLLIINITSLIMLPLIMVGQNLLNREDQVRADQALDATLTSYENILTILECLDDHEKKLVLQIKLLNSLLKSSKQDSKKRLDQTNLLNILLKSSGKDLKELGVDIGKLKKENEELRPSKKTSQKKRNVF